MSEEKDLQDDGSGGLSHLQDLLIQESQDEPYFLDESPDYFLVEEDLPFTRMKLLDDEAEDELSAVQTGQ